MGRVIFVTAFKGGVGKTTTSAGISAALASLGKRVCVVDGDFGMRCMDLVLGMEDRVLYDCGDVLFGRCSLEEAIVPLPQRENLHFLPAPIRYDGTPFPPGSEEKLFSYLRKEYDYCIVDSSAELSGYYRRFAMQADEAVVVSLHQSTAIRAAEKTAANLAQFGHNRVRLVVNGYRAAYAKDGRLPTVLEMIHRSCASPWWALCPCPRSFRQGRSKVWCFSAARNGNGSFRTRRLSSILPCGFAEVRFLCCRAFPVRSGRRKPSPPPSENCPAASRAAFEP